MTDLDVVTGAFSYSGAAIARAVEASGRRVRTLTGHPERAPAGTSNDVWPLAFETGKWEGHLGSEHGPAVIGGRYSAQWVKRGDRWLIRSEVFVALEGSGSGLQMKAVP